MKVRKNRGHFQYEYTKDTEEYNVFISLAPYCLPLFTIPVFILSLIIWHDLQIMLLAIGCAFGADFSLNLRDIGSHQTDLTRIHGGYFMALLYVALANAAFLGILLAWVFQQVFGFKYLFYGLWKFVIHLIAYYLGK